MMKVRQRLDTREAIFKAIDGHEHLPIEVLSEFLLDHYAVDLDVLAELADEFPSSTVMAPAPHQAGALQSEQSAA